MRSVECYILRVKCNVFNQKCKRLNLYNFEVKQNQNV